MDKGLLSIVIPACNERLLGATVDDLYAKAAGPIEVLAILDGGPWPHEAGLPPLDPRAIVIRHNEQMGMRPSENEAIAVASGEFIMKLDGHCIVAPGFDTCLKESCEPGTLVVPTRHSLRAEAPCPECGQLINVSATGVCMNHDAPVPVPIAGLAFHRRDYNYHSLTFPYLPTVYGEGLHAVTLKFGRENDALNAAYADRDVDKLLSFQGSCWVQRKADFDRLGPLDHANYYFYQEAQEVGLRVWMTGGECRIDKRTWYAHLHKGRDNRGASTEFSAGNRGFFLSNDRKRNAEVYAADFWLNDRWPGASRTFRSLIEEFLPLIDRLGTVKPDFAWPYNWRHLEQYRQAFYAREAAALPAHTPDTRRERPTVGAHGDPWLS